MVGVNWAVLNAILLALSFAIDTVNSGAASSATGAAGRRRLKSNESIGQYLRRTQIEGIARPRFTIVGEINYDAADGGPQEIDFDVVQAHSAVTDATTYSLHGGDILPVPDMGIKFLVSDNQQDDRIGNLETFSFFAVDVYTGSVNGISQTEDEEPMNIAQQMVDSDSTHVTTVTKADAFVPPDWTCGVTGSGGRGQNNPIDRRVLAKDMEEEDHHSGHNHFLHSNINDEKPNFFSLMESLNDHAKTFPEKNSKSRERKLYATDNFPALYSYEVGLYIEIDAGFVAANNNDFGSAIQYVNTIVTAASSIYEREIDTHCESIFVDLKICLWGIHFN